MIVGVQNRKVKVNTKQMIQLPKSRPGEVYEIEQMKDGYRLRKIEKEPTPAQIEAIRILGEKAMEEYKAGKTISLEEMKRRLGLD